METPTTPPTQSPLATTTLEPAHHNGNVAETSAETEAHVVDAEAKTSSPRRAPLYIGVALVVSAAVIVGWLIASNGDDTSDEAAANAPVIQATTAEVRDLIEYSELAGTLTYGESFTIAPRRDGTITELVEPGEAVERGDVLWAIDELPTVLFYGTTPIYRDLTSGDEGGDVAMVEENLAALGFTAEETLLVDDVFDAATSDAIEEMQRSLGVAETGTILLADVHVEAGPLAVDATTSRPGSGVRADTALLDASLVESTRVLLAPTGGLVTDVAAPGTVLDNGTTLYEIDTTPVPILVGDTIERTFDIGVDAGDDIESFKRLLVDLGFDADGQLEVDGEWDGAAAEALADWEDVLGVEVDGILQVDQFVILAEPGTIAETSIERGDDIGPGTAVATLVDPTQVVTTRVTIDDRDLLSLGTAVDVDLGGEQIVNGTVTWVSSSSSLPAGQPDADPEFEVEITLDEVPEAFAEFAELDVTVLLVDDIAEAAVTVPASALISTGSSFAVEVVEGSSTRFVEVDPGMFADGWVEVVGIEAGTAVVVPS